MSQGEKPRGRRDERYGDLGAWGRVNVCIRNLSEKSDAPIRAENYGKPFKVSLSIG